MRPHTATLKCGVALLEQHSNKPCTAGVTFGCIDRHTFWSSCRGQFRCGSTTKPRACGYPPGAASYNCSCHRAGGHVWAESSDLPFQRSACAFSRDAPSLDPIALRRSLAAPGADARWRATFAKLDAGRPLTLGLFGASVAQNAGCISQPDKRCFKYGPHNNVHGFAVQLLEHLNRSWPHAGHTIQNAALDATPLTAAIPCLFTHVVPGSLDVVIAESGSMAPFMKDVPRFSTIESFVRQLLSHGRAPVIILLSIRDWCKGGGRGDVWASAAAEELRVCEHYGLTCISPRAALEPLLVDGRLNVSDVAGRRLGLNSPLGVGCEVEWDPNDCLHPLKSRWRRGAALLAEMLAYAFDRAAARAAGAPAEASTARRRERLPPPLHEVNAAVERPYACYSLEKPYAILPESGAQKLLPLQWRTGLCDPSATADCRVAPPTNNVSAHCPSLRASRVAYAEFLHAPPPAWIFCSHSLSPLQAQRKPSPGVVALVAGAVLEFDLPDRRAGAPQSVGIEHLTSYEGMGTAEVECRGVCRCGAQRIDAHTAAASVRASTWEWHTWEMESSEGAGKCALRLTVLAGTSSGGHKFKVRGIRM